MYKFWKQKIKQFSAKVKAAEQLDGLDLEVEANETEYKAFQILNQIVEDSEPLWVPEE